MVVFSSTIRKNDEKQNRYFHKGKNVELNENSNGQFKGIIHHLTKKCSGNVDEKNVVKVTASSIFNDRYPKYVVDLEDEVHFFTSDCKQNSWVKFDFIDKKVKPNKYRSRRKSFQKLGH